MSDERIKTYLGKMDELLSGGIPKGHVVLVSGMPGTMKSSVAYNIIYYNAKEAGVPGLYITLEQGRDSLLKHMKALGMDHDLVKDKLGIVDIAFLRKSMFNQRLVMPVGRWVQPSMPGTKSLAHLNKASSFFSLVHRIVMMRSVVF